MALSIPGTLASWIAYGLFRSPLARHSERTHHWVMKLFRYGAERGNRLALATYGALLHFRGADEGSRLQGALYIKAAAELGDARSQWLLAQFYEKGLLPVIPHNPRLAVETLERSGQQGHPLALKRLVDLYRQGGLGIEPDPKRAEHWDSRRR